MSKTVSARLQESKHDELRERCNRLGCTMNDFLRASIEFALDGKTDFDFGDEETTTNNQIIKEEPSTDKILTNREEKIPCLHFHWEGDKLVQDETTWEEKSV